MDLCIIWHSYLVILLCCYGCYSCPTACSCDYPRIVFCAGMQLREIPPDVPLETNALILGSNFIHFVSWDSFLEVRRLIELHLDRNLIGIIPGKAFLPLVNLKFLDLRHNKIKRIPRLAFSGLVKLNRLNLAGNLIAAIDAGALKFVPRLRTLNLYDNPLSELPGGLFTSSTLMTSLNIGKCDLHTLTKSTFYGLRNLTTLVLGENENLDALQDDAFAELLMLEKLTLNHGGLKRITPGAFSGLERLKELLLDHNRLAHTLSLTTFEDSPNLEVLRLDGNRMSSLHYNVVSSLKYLQKLQLDDNRWRCDCGLLGVRAFWSSGKPSGLTSPGIRCTYPDKYRDLSLWNIPVRSLVDSCLRNIEVATITLSVNIDSPAELDCSLSVRNDSYLAWFSSKTAYIPTAINRSNNSRFLIHDNGVLNIDPVTRDDLGPFICSVTYSDGGTAMRAVELVTGNEEDVTGEKTSRLMTYVIVIVTFTILALLIMLLLLVVIIQRKHNKDDRRPLSYNPFAFFTLRAQTNTEGDYAYAYADVHRRRDDKPYEIDAYAISGNIADEKFQDGIQSSIEVDNMPVYGSFVMEEPEPTQEKGSLEIETTHPGGLSTYAYVSPDHIQLEKMRMREEKEREIKAAKGIEEAAEQLGDDIDSEQENRESSGYIEVID